MTKKIEPLRKDREPSLLMLLAVVNLLIEAHNERVEGEACEHTEPLVHTKSGNEVYCGPENRFVPLSETGFKSTPEVAEKCKCPCHWSPTLFIHHADEHCVGKYYQCGSNPNQIPVYLTREEIERVLYCIDCCVPTKIDDGLLKKLQEAGGKP